MISSDDGDSVGCIVCATRGGAGSRAVQEKAITEALASNSRLLFLYVIDVSGEEHIEEQLRIALQDELRWLGSALLQIAKNRADRKRVASEVIVREGQVREEICRFLEEVSADLLLLGAPRGTSKTIFGDDPVEKFAESIIADSGVLVEIVRPELNDVT